MTGIVAVPGVITSRDATLIKAVVAGIMPEIGGLLREATTPLLGRIEALEKRELVLPEKGEPGEQGPQGEPGPAGEVDMDVVKALVDAAVAALPPAERGEKGERGEDGLPGEKGADGAPGVAGEPGKDGDDGKDGVGLADALIDKDGGLVLTMTDGRTKSLGRVIGKDGETFTLDDFDMVPLTERAFDFRFTHGGECHSFEVKFDVPLYRGVFKEAGEYERGDMVTWAGSTWHCDEPKGLKPGAPDSGWTLAVKAGRAGKDLTK